MILLLGFTALTAYSQPGAKRPAAPIPCLTANQRQHLADSLARLPQLRRAAQEFRYAADTAYDAAVKAKRAATGFASALVAQQKVSTAYATERNEWKAKARRRGLLNWLFVALASGALYAAVAP